jgi:hypothetical protein
MKVIIAGTRYKDADQKNPFDDYALIVEAVERSGFKITEVVSGCAIGTDRLGEQWAKANNIPVKEMPATPHDWHQYGKRAGPMRNKRMAEYADAAIVVWDGKSPGTRNMVENMIRRKKPYYVALTSVTLEDFI